MSPDRGRTNQRLRTRKDLLDAGLRLSAEGRQPSLDEIAAEARVSRATAYRYFSGAEALLVEASADMSFPDLARLFSGHEAASIVDRLVRLDRATATMIRDHEPAIRALVASSMQQAMKAGAVPVRQNRRTPAIAAALEPARQQISPEAYAMLEKALALVIGTEAMIVLKDVLGLAERDAAQVRRWVIEALVEKAAA